MARRRRENFEDLESQNHDLQGDMTGLGWVPCTTPPPPDEKSYIRKSQISNTPDLRFSDPS